MWGWIFNLNGRRVLVFKKEWGQLLGRPSVANIHIKWYFLEKTELHTSLVPALDGRSTLMMLTYCPMGDFNEIIDQ